MTVTLTKEDWRRVVRQFTERADWIQELNAITFAAMESESDAVAVDLHHRKADEVGQLLWRKDIIETASMMATFDFCFI